MRRMHDRMRIHGAWGISSAGKLMTGHLLAEACTRLPLLLWMVPAVAQLARLLMLPNAGYSGCLCIVQASSSTKQGAGAQSVSGRVSCGEGHAEGLCCSTR